jgi:hypothetical protein
MAYAGQSQSLFRPQLQVQIVLAGPKHLMWRSGMEVESGGIRVRLSFKVRLSTDRIGVSGPRLIRISGTNRIVYSSRIDHEEHIFLPWKHTRCQTLVMKHHCHERPYILVALSYVLYPTVAEISLQHLMIFPTHQYHLF